MDQMDFSNVSISQQIAQQHNAAAFLLRPDLDQLLDFGSQAQSPDQSTTVFMQGSFPNFHNPSPPQEEVPSLVSKAEKYIQREFPLAIGAPNTSRNLVREDYFELYRMHFHHRWPIIHLPSFNQGDDPYVLTACVDMIGAWLQGGCQARLVALTLHDRLMKHIVQRLVCIPTSIR